MGDRDSILVEKGGTRTKLLAWSSRSAVGVKQTLKELEAQQHLGAWHRNMRLVQTCAA